MSSNLKIRRGSDKALASEFMKLYESDSLNFKLSEVWHPGALDESNILAVHYADGGAQGEAGAVRILYEEYGSVKILYGNYVYGDLDLDALIRKLPMLECLNPRGGFALPYPFGGKLSIPDGWQFVYMGAMNYFFHKRRALRQSNTIFQRSLRKRRYCVADIRRGRVLILRRREILICA